MDGAYRAKGTSSGLRCGTAYVKYDGQDPTPANMGGYSRYGGPDSLDNDLDGAYRAKGISRGSRYGNAYNNIGYGAGYGDAAYGYGYEVEAPVKVAKKEDSHKKVEEK